MTTGPITPEEFQQAVLTKLDGIDADLDDLKQRMATLEQRERWDERAWRVIQFAGSASITLSVAASLGLLLLVGKAVFFG